MSQEALKRLAAETALTSIERGMVLGLGTGSTVRHLVDLLGEALRTGALSDIVAVPTSVQTEVQAGGAGIPLIELGDREYLDLTIDGADEVSPELDLIKGLGGALLREKMVAQASRRLLIIADESKMVDRLGTRTPLPVEVVDWALDAQVCFLESLGATVELRSTEESVPMKSDNGNVFLDCTFPEGIEDPAATERLLAFRAGIVDTGLFLGMASEAVIASPNGIQTLRRAS